MLHALQTHDLQNLAN